MPTDLQRKQLYRRRRFGAGGGGGGGGPTSTTFISGTNGGRISSSGTLYPGTRAGGTLTTSADHAAGQRDFGGSFIVDAAYFDFLTNVGGGKVVSSATFSAVVNGGAPTGKVFQLRLYDFGPTLENADWVPGANLAATTLLATYTSAAEATGVRVTFANVALPANINVTGSSRFIVVPADNTNNVAPTGTPNVVSFFTGADATPANRPNLALTYS